MSPLLNRFSVGRLDPSRCLTSNLIFGPGPLGAYIRSDILLARCPAAASMSLGAAHDQTSRPGEIARTLAICAGVGENVLPTNWKPVPFVAWTKPGGEEPDVVIRFFLFTLQAQTKLPTM